MANSKSLNEVNNMIGRSTVLPEDDRASVVGLMLASQQTIAPLIEKEADSYTVADLKVRFK